MILDTFDIPIKNHISQIGKLKSLEPWRLRGKIKTAPGNPERRFILIHIVFLLMLSSTALARTMSFAGTGTTAFATTAFRFFAAFTVASAFFSGATSTHGLGLITQLLNPLHNNGRAGFLRTEFHYDHFRVNICHCLFHAFHCCQLCFNFFLT